jgi:hypothetical protein
MYELVTLSREQGMSCTALQTQVCFHQRSNFLQIFEPPKFPLDLIFFARALHIHIPIMAVLRAGEEEALNTAKKNLDVLDLSPVHASLKKFIRGGSNIDALFHIIDEIDLALESGR